MRANAAAIPKANFLIIQLAALTGIQRWGCGGLKLEKVEKGLMWFSLKFHTKSEDELEKD